MNVKEIIKKYLIDNGYDGLCDPDGECGCTLVDFNPCGECICRCEPAYQGPDISGDADYGMYASKEDRDAAIKEAEEKKE